MQLLHSALVWWLLLALACLASLEVQASPKENETDQKPIIIGYVNIPPYAYAKNGKPAGAINDLTHRIMEQLPYRYTHKLYPIKRLLQLLKAGKVHVWVSASIPKLIDPYILHGDISVMQAGITIYSSVPFTAPPWQGITGPVIYIQGYAYQGLRGTLAKTRPDITFIGSPTHVSGFKMLKVGRAKYLLDYTLPAGEAIRKLAMTNIHSVHLYSMPVNFHVSKKAPNAKLFLEELEAAYLALPPQAPKE
ncbi:MAG: hypothetical protein KUG56_00180 [Kordiimonadaceae bacterium]|nr:hypothetical protein [Kordiimonadaceae bacterium]